jgi:hypothetical protein
VRALEDALRDAGADLAADGDVVGPRLVEPPRAGGGRLHHVGERRLRIPVDAHGGERVLGGVAVLGDDGGHGLARVDRAVGREHREIALALARRMRQHRQRTDAPRGQPPSARPRRRATSARRGRRCSRCARARAGCARRRGAAARAGRCPPRTGPCPGAAAGPPDGAASGR